MWTVYRSDLSLHLYHATSSLKITADPRTALHMIRCLKIRALKTTRLSEVVQVVQDCLALRSVLRAPVVRSFHEGPGVPG